MSHSMSALTAVMEEPTSLKAQRNAGRNRWYYHDVSCSEHLRSSLAVVGLTLAPVIVWRRPVHHWTMSPACAASKEKTQQSMSQRHMQPLTPCAISGTQHYGRCKGSDKLTRAPGVIADSACACSSGSVRQVDALSRVADYLPPKYDGVVKLRHSEWNSSRTQRQH